MNNEALELSNALATTPEGMDFERLRREVKWHLRPDVEPMHVQLAAQQAAYEHHRTTGLPGFGYYLEQGLGKTALALNEFMDLVEGDVVDVMVVIAPPTFLLDWEIAVVDWLPAGKRFPTCSWPQNPLAMTAPNTGGRPRIQLGALKPPFLFAINWEMTRMAAGKDMLSEILNKFRVFLVQDETSYIKNAETAMGRNVIQIAKDATQLRGLNGTPMTQNFMDIYAQYRALRLWSGTLSRPFKNEFAVVGGFKGKQIVGVKPEKLDAFNAKVAKHCFRAMKRDWAPHLPPKIFVPRAYQMTPEQRDIYHAMEEEFYAEIDGVDIDVEMAASQRIKLQQISSGFALDGDGIARRIMPADKNPKLLALLGDLRVTDGKVIVPRYFRESAVLIREAFDAEGVKYVEMVGGMKKADMIAIKDQFNRDDETDVIILPTDVGRMGHTLLGNDKRRCADMFLFETTYNLLSRLQIEDRNHRHGQDSERCRYLDYVGTKAEKDIAEGLAKKVDMTEILINSIRARPGATGDLTAR